MVTGKEGEERSREILGHLFPKQFSKETWSCLDILILSRKVFTRRDILDLEPSIIKQKW
jgi:hypothetical protein